MSEAAENQGDFPEWFKDSMPMKVFFEMGEMKDNPRILILVTHGFIELLVNALIDARFKNAKRITSNNHNFSHSAKLIMINEMGLIGDTQFRLLDYLRKLRNKAAHEPLFEISHDSIRADILNIVGHNETHPALDSTTDSNTLYDFCHYVKGALWNRHKDIFGPIFDRKNSD